MLGMPNLFMPGKRKARSIPSYEPRPVDKKATLTRIPASSSSASKTVIIM